METYEMMRIGFYVCLAVAGLFLVLTIMLFFMFDIPGIISARSGKAKAKTIQEMKDTNSTTGRLLQKKHTPKTTGNLDKKVKVKKGTVLTPDQMNGSSITEEIKAPQENANPAEGSSETAALGADTAMTAPLGADAAQTAVLGADAAQTAVLGAEPAQTAVLGTDAVTQRFGESETAVLVQSASVPPAEGVTFEVVKKVILCDTQEIVD